MELPLIGKKCTEPTCNQLDFLPLQCKCGKLFCSDHFNQHVQICELTKDNQAVELKKIVDLHKCSRPGCAENSVVAIICAQCHKHFCVKHRHNVGCEEKTPEELAVERERYQKPVRQFKEAKVVVDKQLENNLNEAKKKEKNKNLANKLQLMRIKNKAAGLKTIPPGERVYFNVSHPNSSDKISPVFVSKNWSLGRVIDAVALECKLQNNNNKSNEKKLRLFKKDDNKSVSQNMSVILSDLLSNSEIFDGESLVIEYVDVNSE